MLDRFALDLLKPLTTRAAEEIKSRGYTADHVTFVGFGLGILAALTIAAGFPGLAILPLLASRAADGFDGAVARLGTPTDRGAFVDIALDFLFYGAIPLGFAFADPVNNAVAAAVLLFSFIGTGTSFLAYAIIAEKRGLSTETKGFFYLGGLTEGFETILCFLLMCWWPAYFALFAYIFAALCALTTAMRIRAGWRAFGL
jgi:phosphatidylglycerophosphate synthase